MMKKIAKSFNKNKAKD